MTGYAVIAGVLAMIGGPMPAVDAGKLIGNWGGHHITLAMTVAGARIALDCGAGAFAAAADMDRRGNFTARGTWSVFRPGPTPVEGQEAVASPASFRGRVVGDQLTLEVSVASLPAPQRYVLTRDVRVKLIRCL